MLNIHQIAEEMEAQFYQKVEDGIETWATHANRASALGHPCDRSIWYSRTRWQDALSHDATTELIFKDGRVHEDATIQIMRDMGFSVVEQQRTYFWKKYVISGHIDGKVLWTVDKKKVAIPFEIKGYAGHQAQALRTISDFFDSPRHYVRRAPIQLSVYLKLEEEDQKRRRVKKADRHNVGLFIIKNKNNGRLHWIPYELNPEILEIATSQAVRINTHLDNGTEPERIEYDPKLCEDCKYRHLCLVDVIREPAAWGDEKLQEKLEEWWKVKDSAEKFKVLDKELKAEVRGKRDILTPRFHITGSETSDGKWLTRIDPLF